MSSYYSSYSSNTAREYQHSTEAGDYSAGVKYKSGYEKKEKYSKSKTSATKRYFRLL